MSSRSKVVYIDAYTSGVSGDMILAALVDLGADEQKIREEVLKVSSLLSGVKEVSVSFEETSLMEFRGKKLVVSAVEDVQRREGKEILEVLEKYKALSNLSEKAKKKVEEIFLTLLSAEAKVHKESIEEVDLHESGSVDTFIDVVGTVTALDSLGLFNNCKIVSSPLAVGGGTITFSHGTVSVPAPATLEILTRKNFPFRGGPINFELTTPTGAAIVTNIAEEVLEQYPLMKPIKIGLGIGSINEKGFVDVLRVILGEQNDKIYSNDKVIMVETNVDDVDGETLGFLIEKVMEEGAKDITILPGITKKNRPMYLISVMCDLNNYEKIVETLFNETKTLGVRIKEVDRITLQRETKKIEVEIKEKKFEVTIKVIKGLNGKTFRAKPEFEDVKRIAKELNMPITEIKKIIAEKINLS
ncbi:nickel pincer cofactor biosynthesis protein LarC [archaeon]|nr:nickel pincer cofactor biosynthesis protein LarC [archaeon]